MLAQAWSAGVQGIRSDSECGRGRPAAAEKRQLVTYPDEKKSGAANGQQRQLGRNTTITAISIPIKGVLVDVHNPIHVRPCATFSS